MPPPPLVPGRSRPWWRRNRRDRRTTSPSTRHAAPRERQYSERSDAPTPADAIDRVTMVVSVLCGRFFGTLTGVPVVPSKRGPTRV